MPDRIQAIPHTSMHPDTARSECTTRRIVGELPPRPRRGSLPPPVPRGTLREDPPPETTVEVVVAEPQRERWSLAVAASIGAILAAAVMWRMASNQAVLPDRAVPDPIRLPRPEVKAMAHAPSETPMRVDDSELEVHQPRSARDVDRRPAETFSATVYVGEYEVADREP